MFRKLLVGIVMSVFLSGFSDVVQAESAAPPKLTDAQASFIKSRAKSVAAATTSLGSISGVVFDKTSGLAAAGVSVTAKPVTSYGTCEVSSNLTVSTDLDGYYTIPALPDGPYLVNFTMHPAVTMVSGSSAPGFIPQWYKYVADETHGTVLQVSSSGTFKNIDALLERAGSISGNVSDASGPLFLAYVTVTSEKGLKTVATTDMSGNYTALGLASGSYTVAFKGPSPSPYSIPGMPVTPQYLPGQYPTPVVVTAPNDTPAINMKFTQAGGSITGTVSPATGTLPAYMTMMLSVREPGTGTYLGNAYATLFQGNFTFSIGGLASGTYDLVVNDFGSNNNFTAVRVNGVVVSAPGSANVGTVTLQPGGRITGSVKSSDGTPLQNAYVMAFNGRDTGGFDLTAADGTYTISGLTTGDYTLQFSICNGGYLEQWYNGKASQVTGDSVHVTAPAATSGINVIFTTSNANLSPVAYPRSVSVVSNTSRSLTIAATDGNSDHLTYAVVAQPLHGTVSGTPPNLVYTPAQDYSGPDGFTFKANDGKADSNIAAVTLAVGAPSSTAVKGDVNGDGSINVIDALLTMQYAIDLIPKNPETDAHYLATADVAPLDTVSSMPKGNNTVDIADALMILRRVLNLDTWLPTGGGTTLSLVTPQNGAVKVSSSTSIQMNASQALDPAAVNSSTIKLLEMGPYGTFTFAGSVEYGAGQKSVSYLHAGLNPARSYQLDFTGVKDLGGAPVTGVVSLFSTLDNTRKRHVRYNPDGTIYSYSECSFTTAGKISTCNEFDGAGADSTWFDADDSISSFTDYEYSAEGNLSRTILHQPFSYKNPDVGGIWFTMDFVVAGYSSYTYGPAGQRTRVINFINPGPDGVWYTADDTVSDYGDYLYDAGSRLIRISKYTSSGADGIWFTSDDELVTYRTQLYDQNGYVSGYAAFSDPGTDKLWFTADDVLMIFEKTVRDNSGVPRILAAFSSFDFKAQQPGQDLWARGDVTGYWENRFDSGGRLNRIVHFGDPGLDGVWRTADDVMFSYCTYDYTSDGIETQKSCFAGQGADSTWFTDDDLIQSRDEYESTW